MIVFSDHARWQVARRGLDENSVRLVAEAPEQVEVVRAGREVRQKRMLLPKGGELTLLRVVVDLDAETETIVTAYQTSKIMKYWRTP